MCGRWPHTKLLKLFDSTILYKCLFSDSVCFKRDKIALPMRALKAEKKAITEGLFSTYDPSRMRMLQYFVKLVVVVIEGMVTSSEYAVK